MFGDYVEGEFGASVFVKEAFVVEGARPHEGAGGGIGAAVDELPEGDARDARRFIEIRQDFFQKVCLIFFRPMGAEAVAPSVDGASSYFADNERFVIESSLVEEFDELIEFGADFANGAQRLLIGGIPARIGVEADNVNEIEVDVFRIGVGRVCDKTCVIKLAKRADHVFIEFPSIALQA